MIDRRMEKFQCVEPFYEENKKKQADTDMDDKRRLMMKDKQEIARQMNLSKMIRQVSNDLDQYSSKNKNKAEEVQEEAQPFSANNSEE